MSEQARTTAPARLRAALAGGGPVVAAYAADPLATLLVERIGFPAAYVGGGALGYVLGTTEARLTSTDVVNVVRQITAVCDLPPFNRRASTRDAERVGRTSSERGGCLCHNCVEGT